MPWPGTVAWDSPTTRRAGAAGRLRQGSYGRRGRARGGQAGEKTSTMRRAWCAAAGRTIGSLTPAAR